jgi:hypothetical protein
MYTISPSATILQFAGVFGKAYDTNFVARFMPNNTREAATKP